MPSFNPSVALISSDTPVVLVTINAKYLHTSLALKYLQANLKSFQASSHILEFTLQERTVDIAERILACSPGVVVFSCYIWNIDSTSEVIRVLRQVQPGLPIVLGGPEVSYPLELPPICEEVQHVICGEGEEALQKLLANLQHHRPCDKTISAPLVDLDQLTLPYFLYTDEDIAHRVVYVESSRGCAFGCEFCLSSLDTKVRYFDVDKLLHALAELWQRGARQFKFIDRTIHLSKASRILEFFSARICPELFLHFEIVPDQITDKLIAALQPFPPGAVQLEAGVQTFTQEVSTRIGRKQQMEKTEANLRAIVSQTGVHIHSDLVVGLPGETIDTLAQSFDRLIKTGVHEIQVGILKRLRGAPIARHTTEFQMVYSDTAPYEILQNRDIPFVTMQRLKRFSRYFDLVSNNGNFQTTAGLIWQDGSAFDQFMHFCDWLFSTCGRTASIALDKLADYLFQYLVTERNMPRAEVANSIKSDFVSNGRRRMPKCVREFASNAGIEYSETGGKRLPERQQRHKR